MVERKIIFECVTGSHMYGTSTPNSDEDYKGVYLPSSEDVLSIFHKCPKEWDLSIKSKDENGRNTKDAIDRTTYSLPFFLWNVSKGQPWAIEMLYAPKNIIKSQTKEWLFLKKHAPDILTKNIGAFTGFAIKQCNKATLKGQNLRNVQFIISMLQEHPSKSSACIRDILKDDALCVRDKVCSIQTSVSRTGAPIVVINGRGFDYGLSVKRFLASLITMESEYGDRVRAAAEETYDYKSLYHAYRALSEAEEFLTSGVISLPRPDAEFLLKIRNKEVDRDHITHLTKEMERIYALERECNLFPQETDTVKVDNLCHIMLKKHLGVQS